MMDLDRLGARLSPWMAPFVIVVALIVGRTMGVGPAFLVLAGGTLVGVVLLLWSSLGRLTGESPLTLEEAIGMAAPSPQEERKRSILRALKDLEYERSVGKISDEDYAELTARYRTDAKALLQKIESETADARQKAEARLSERLKKEGLAGDGPSKKKTEKRRASEAPESPAAKPAETANDAEISGAPVCAACKTENDVDARFCKRCGAAMTKEGDRAP